MQIDRNGVRISYEAAGAGPTVLMIQGAGVPGAGWSPQVSELQRRFRVITFDNRGVGASDAGPDPLTIEAMAADAGAILEQEGAGSVHLVGHSMGGLIALRLALTRPSQIRSLVLACTFADGAAPTRFSWKMAALGIRSRVGTRAMRRNAMLDMIMPAHYLRHEDRGRLGAELQRLFGRDLADQPPIVMRQLRAMSRHTVVPELRRLDGIPTLVVGGHYDPIAPPRLGRAIASSLASARFVEYTDAGHALPIQCASRFNELVLRHLLAADRGSPPALTRARAAAMHR